MSRLRRAMQIELEFLFFLDSWFLALGSLLAKLVLHCKILVSY